MLNIDHYVAKSRKYQRLLAGKARDQDCDTDLYIASTASLNGCLSCPSLQTCILLNRIRLVRVLEPDHK